MSIVRKLGVVVMVAVILALTGWTGPTVPVGRAAARPKAANRSHPQVTPTAVAGADGYLWLAGTYSCASGTCSALMVSTNGAQTWRQIGSPPVAVVSALSYYGVLSFANREDGYAQGRPGKPLYWTGDGGRRWQQVPLSGDLHSLVTTGGHAYALWCVGGGANCDSRYYLAVSSVEDNSWTTTPLSPATNAQIVFLTAWRSRVWLVVTPAGGGETRLLVSSNGGRTFSKPSATGLSGYSAKAIASSYQTLWGISYGGSLVALARSTDGGKRFLGFPEEAGVDFLPGTRVFPVSSHEALAADSLGLGLFLTFNGGQSFTRVLPRAQILDVGFATGDDWLTLGNPHPTVAWSPPTSVWLTTDGGRSWQRVKAPRV